MPGAVEIGNGEVQMVDQHQTMPEPVYESALICFSECQGESLQQLHCDRIF